MTVNLNANMSASALAAYADSKVDDNVREDLKLNRSRRSAALQSHVDAARNQIELNKEAADERLQAAKDKADGGFWGGIIGIILAVVAIVAGIICCCTGVGAVVGAALIGLGAACLAAGSSVGGAAGAKAAEDNEENADALKERADNAGVDEKVYEKTQEDLRDQIKSQENQLNQIWQDARKRRAEENKVILG
jgi:hypothetical protein